MIRQQAAQSAKQREESDEEEDDASVESQETVSSHRSTRSRGASVAQTLIERVRGTSLLQKGKKYNLQEWDMVEILVQA